MASPPDPPAPIQPQPPTPVQPMEGASEGSRLRHGLGQLLFLLSLVAAASFSLVYLSRRLWLGLFASLALLLLLLSGTESFRRARRRLLAELLAFEGPGPAAVGTFLHRREAELVALKRRGGRPELTALSQRAQAETGRAAYFGRYFVAVAVLVGLLGTFAGLMETLAGVSALLADDSTASLSGVLRLLATPLAGLHVTFGASMVGILCTVSLALLQGDLALLDDELLSRLEDHTAHVLLPRIFPPSEDAGERALSELAALRKEMPKVLQHAAELVETTTVHMAAAEARAEARVQDLAEECLRQVALHAAQTAEALGRHGDKLADLLDSRQRQSNEAQGAQLRKVVTQVEQLVHKIGEEEEDRGAARRAADGVLIVELSRAAQSCMKSAQEGAERATTAIGAAGHKLVAEIGAASTEALSNLRAEALAQTQALSAGGAAQIERAVHALSERTAREGEAAAAELRKVTLALTEQAVVLSQAEAGRVADLSVLRQRLEDLLKEGIAAPLLIQFAAWQEAAQVARDGGEQLATSAQALAEAAQRFAAATDGLLPELRSLSPELHALSAEVALLSAEDRGGGDGELQTQLLAELCRLTEGVELLLRRGGPLSAADHQQPAEAG